MSNSLIKDSLMRLLEYQRITQEQYDAAIDKLDNPKTEQKVIDSIVEEVRK